jgi:5-methyltetrahydrofolate--homocysteine methyltransferase
VHRELAPEGVALVNSVNGEEERIEAVLPLVAEFGAAVIGLTMNDDGIPSAAAPRIEIAKTIVDRAADVGIGPERIVIDCLALTVGADTGAGLVTLDAVRAVREALGVNMTLGASNISFGLPAREQVNWAFLALVIQAGVNCPIVDAAKVRAAILAADLVLGRDEYAMRHIRYQRKLARKRAAK